MKKETLNHRTTSVFCHCLLFSSWTRSATPYMFPFICYIQHLRLQTYKANMVTAKIMSFFYKGVNLYNMLHRQYLTPFNIQSQTPENLVLKKP